jgi:hypothetical protein
MNIKSTKFIICLTCITLLICSSKILASSPEAFNVYKDPLGRYSLKYPSTMKVQDSNPNEALIFHPDATFRISIAIEKRIKKGPPNVAGFLEAFKKNLKLETRDLEILKEGKSSNIEGAQAYLSYAFTDKRGIRLVQLCQYYASETSFLQLIISDKQEGFKNLEPIIWEIHKSLRILKPTLQ